MIRILATRPGPLARRAAVGLALAGGVVLLLLWLASRSPFEPVLGRRVPATMPPVEELARSPMVVNQGRLGGAPASPGDTAAPWGRRIIRQAVLTIELDDVERAIARLTELVEAAGGYVADTQVSNDGTGVARATLTAYVPSGGFGHALADLERFGRPTTRRVSGQDVSEEFVDLEARVRNLERHEAQLLGFMGKAQKVADLVTLENELARVRGEIERLTGRIRFLRARSEMAGIQVSLLRATTPVSEDGRLARAWERVQAAFVAGWKAAFDAAVGLAAVAAQWSPLVIVAVLGWVLYRRLRRQPAAAGATPA
jgi:hypothetical protein